jgi:hypothetical protein
MKCFQYCYIKWLNCSHDYPQSNRTISFGLSGNASGVQSRGAKYEISGSTSIQFYLSPSWQIRWYYSKSSHAHFLEYCPKRTIFMFICYHYWPPRCTVSWGEHRYCGLYTYMNWHQSSHTEGTGLALLPTTSFSPFVEVQLQAPLTFGNRWKWVVSCSGCLFPGKQSPNTL